jgi:hypothetical protein
MFSVAAFARERLAGSLPDLLAALVTGAEETRRAGYSAQITHSDPRTMQVAALNPQRPETSEPASSAPTKSRGPS